MKPFFEREKAKGFLMKPFLCSKKKSLQTFLPARDKFVDFWLSCAVKSKLTFALTKVSDIGVMKRGYQKEDS